MIRPLTLNDLAQVTAIESLDPYTPWTENLIRDCLKHEHHYNWALFDAEVLVAYLICQLAVSDMELMMIGVAEKYRRRGYAQQLMETAIADSARLAERMILEVRQDNWPAIQFYEKLGFQQIGQRANYYRSIDNQQDALVYALNLAKRFATN